MSYGPLPLSALTGENSKCKPYIIPQFIQQFYKNKYH